MESHWDNSYHSSVICPHVHNQHTFPDCNDAVMEYAQGVLLGVP